MKAKVDRHKLNSKKTMAHVIVTHKAMARKILKKINSLGKRIEPTQSILMSRPGNMLINLTNAFSLMFIFGHMFAQGHGFDAVTVTIEGTVALSCLPSVRRPPHSSLLRVLGVVFLA